MTKLPFLNNNFDLISCLEGIEHITVENGMSFIAEAARVLRSKGKILLTSPYSISIDKDHSGNPYHLHEYCPEEITELIEECFEIEEHHTRIVCDLSISYIKAKVIK